MNSQADLWPDSPHWDALRAFAVAEIETQRGHARCFRALAALLSLSPQGVPAAESGPELPGASPEQMAAACREVADGTDAETARVEDALRRDDRAEVARMANACVEGYLRGLRHRGAL